MGSCQKSSQDELLHLDHGPCSVDGNPERLPFVRVDADPYREGYDRFWLRADVVDAYKNVREEVNRRGGIITSSGARRSLNAQVSSNRSQTSFHYTGRALDLFVWSEYLSKYLSPIRVKGRLNHTLQGKPFIQHTCFLLSILFIVVLSTQ